ncbi:aldo/keto reductase [Formicincola oecophyllae]|uniref:aldo/keto reductase n=1 Tax=Formicincola oecophyllae TaxID=2558361 RepID=UPI0038D1192C
MTPDKITINGLEKPVTRIALGTWAIGGWMWGGPDDANAIKTIHKAVEEGINLIDTAPVYGFGHSEKVVGEAVAQLPASQKPYIATKLGLNWNEDHKPFRDSRPQRIRQEVEDSLKRLRVEVLDLVQVHWPDAKTPIAETASALNDLRKEGKIRALGVSNYSTAQMDEFRKEAPLSTSQDPFNIFETAIEKTVIPYAEKNDMDVLAYGPLCRGLLTGKITADTTFPEGDLRRMDPKFQPENLRNYVNAVKALEALAASQGKTVLSLAIRWVLDQGPTIALWGARKPAQVEGVKDALGWTLSPEIAREVSSIVTKYIPTPIDASFMAPPNR